MENKDMGQPRVVSSHDIYIDTEYADWIAEVKHRYRSAQVKAAVRVNAMKNSTKLVEKNSNDPLEKSLRMNLCNDPLQNFHKCLV